MNNPFYTSDWHIHSVASYDANLHVADLVSQAEIQGLTDYGLTDHVNVPSWIHYLLASRELFRQFARPGFHFGVELTTISGYLEAYDRKHGTKDGYTKPDIPGPEPVAFPLTSEELEEAGVEYVIGAGHWVLDSSRTQDVVIKDMHRQNLICAASPLVDIVGHPYFFSGTYEDRNGNQVPFDDFSIIPQSMHEELWAAIRENGKCMEANVGFFISSRKPERFRRAYAEFVRGAFEAGVPITIGTDCHGPKYNDRNEDCRTYLGSVGFRSTDFVIPRFRMPHADMTLQSI